MLYNMEVFEPSQHQPTPYYSSLLQYDLLKDSTPSSSPHCRPSISLMTSGLLKDLNLALISRLYYY